MENNDFEELEDEEINDSPSYESIESNDSDFYNQTLNSKIRDIRKQNKGNQNTINKLRQRNANTMSKSVEAPNSTSSSSDTEQNEDEKQDENIKQKETLNNKLNDLKNQANEKAKQLAKQTKEKAKETVKKTTKKVALFLLKNPYFWIIMGVFLLIMLIPVLWAAYDDDSGSSSESSGGIVYVEGYEDCKSITVTGVGTYTLEDYVAGVITHEAYSDGGEEALKAQAVAARTYAINSTNNCTTSIGNSQSSQTFSTTPSDVAVSAANATAGQVLTYNGSVFSSMYDSFCYEDGDCPDSVKNSDGSYTVTYTKLPNKETHQITLNQEKQYSRIVPGGGHASGMSQLVSYQMASEGKKYDEILYFFYSDGVEISSISETNGGLSISGQFAIRTQKPNINKAPDNIYFNESNAGSNWFQCPWYAKGRAIEILSTVEGIDEEKRELALAAVRASFGNGSDWYSLSQNGGTLSVFGSSTDYSKPKPGSIISWKWTNEHWQNSKYANDPNYGHVGIIEAVNGNKVTVSDGWNNCGGYNKNASCQGFGYRTVDLEYLKNFGGNYIFLGYVYLLD